jgi:hypothetical protein
MVHLHIYTVKTIVLTFAILILKVENIIFITLHPLCATMANANNDLNIKPFLEDILMIDIGDFVRINTSETENKMCWVQVTEIKSIDVTAEHIAPVCFIGICCSDVGSEMFTFFSNDIIDILSIKRYTRDQIIMYAKRVMAMHKLYNDTHCEKYLNYRLVIHNQCEYCGKRTEIKCPRCKVTWYCNTECQVANWETHKIICATIQIITPLELHNVVDKIIRNYKFGKITIM